MSLSALAVEAPAAVAAAYGALDLGTLGGNSSEAIAVNSTGQVVGMSNTAGDVTATEHAFSWTQAGGMVDLGTLDGTWSWAVAVSPSGQVVGYGTHAFSWTKAGGMVDLGTLGGSNSRASAVSPSGQVVGYSYTTGGTDWHAFSWTQAGGMVDLGTLPGETQSSATDVNERGQIVGSSGTSSGAGDAFSWTAAGGMIDLGTLGGDYSDAMAVNSTGQVVGYSPTASDVSDAFGDAFSWTAAGGMVDLGIPAGYDFSNAAAVNDSGQVVGTGGFLRYFTASGGFDAFSWTAAGGMVSLGTLPGYTSSVASAVNDNGQVVGSVANYGYACNCFQAAHAFSWTAAGGMIDLGTLGGTDSEATAVNSNGQVVGYADIAAAQACDALADRDTAARISSHRLRTRSGAQRPGKQHQLFYLPTSELRATGEFWHTYTDASIPGRGVPLDLTRTYNSADATVPGPFGNGWTDSYNMSLSLDTLGNATVTEGDGSTVTFLNTASGFQAPTRVFATLVTNPDGTYTMSDTRRGISYNFSATGQLISESDRNGYLTQLTYASRKLSAVTDPSGRKLTFSYNSSGQV